MNLAENAEEEYKFNPDMFLSNIYKSSNLNDNNATELKTSNILGTNSNFIQPKIPSGKDNDYNDMGIKNRHVLPYEIWGQEMRSRDMNRDKDRDRDKTNDVVEEKSANVPSVKTENSQDSSGDDNNNDVSKSKKNSQYINKL
jgi:hypothetical protein